MQKFTVKVRTPAAGSAARAAPLPVLSVVVPLYNEAGNVHVLLTRLGTVLRDLKLPAEVLIVDDGSSDDTARRVADFAATDFQLRLLQLSRNFGHQAAVVAGLAHARGAASVTMDGDLQHPPELLPRLVERWQAGFEVVQAVRRTPADRSRLKRAGSRVFYRALSWLTRLEVTPGAADFRLLDREAVEAFLACPERRRLNRGLVRWIGFRYTTVPYEAAPRLAGRSKYSWRAMFRLAGDAIFSFSAWPLRLAGLIGVLVSLAAGGYLLFVLWAYFFTDRVQPGWSSILAAVLILGGVNLIVLWILGEYLGRMYEEVKQRPLYIVRPEQPLPPATPENQPVGDGVACSGPTAHST